MESFLIMVAIIFFSCACGSLKPKIEAQRGANEFRRFWSKSDAIERKYAEATYSRKGGRHIHPINAKYVDFVREMIEHYEKNGRKYATTIERAIRQHENAVNEWAKRGGEFDNEGYAIYNNHRQY